MLGWWHKMSFNLQNIEDIIVHYATKMQWICMFYSFHTVRKAKNIALFCTAKHLESRKNGLQSMFLQLTHYMKVCPWTEFWKMSTLQMFIAKTCSNSWAILLYHLCTSSLSCLYKYCALSLQEPILQKTWCTCMWELEP